VLRVNTTTHQLSADPRLALLDARRDVLGLTGTKKGCDEGASRDRHANPVVADLD